LQHAAIGFDDFCIVTAPLANAGIAGIALGSLESRRDRAGIALGSRRDRAGIAQGSRWDRAGIASISYLVRIL
jgi:hypothetical protein